MSYATARERAELSFAQHGMWITERLGGAVTAYHMPLAVHLDGPLDAAALLAACADVTRRHGVLGAAIDDSTGLPVLVPAAADPPITRLRTAADGYAAILRAETRRPFEPRSGPLARFTLVELEPHRHVLLFVAHHLVFDGMSKDILVAELAACYAARALGARADLPPISMPYRRAADLGRDRVAAALPAAAEYWRSRWREPAELVLPGGTARLPRRPEPAASVGVTGTGAIPGAAAALGVTRFEVLLSALHALLAVYGNDTPAVAVDLSTRTPGTDDQIGLYVNELPVTSAPAPAMTFRELTGQIRGRLREIYRFREVPVSRAVGGISPRAALTPVSLSYRRRAAHTDFPGLRCHVDWMLDNHAVRNTLHVQAVDASADDAPAVVLRHNPADLDAEGASRLADDLSGLLAAVAADPDTPLADLPVERPTANRPATDRPTANRPATDRPAADHPAADRPAAEHPAADHPAADRPVADRPVAAAEADHPASTTAQGDVDDIPELVEVVRQIWQEVLRIDGIRPDEDLYDLGGHSLNITQIAARIHKRMGVEIPLDVFLDDPTVAGVAAAVHASGGRP